MRNVDLGMLRWASEDEVKRSASTTEPPQGESQTYSSLALDVLFHQLRQRRNYNILDLGSAFGANVDFLSQFSRRIYIEDLYQTLISFNFFSPEDGVNYADVFEYLLPYRRETCFDVILAWDLFNYLEPPEYLHLTRHLSKYCRTDSFLFALISTHKHIPEKPTNYKIIDQQTLLYEKSSTILRSCPRYEETDLRRLMPDFRVCNSFLLRNGIKEYLFARK